MKKPSFNFLLVALLLGVWSGCDTSDQKPKTDKNNSANVAQVSLKKPVSQDTIKVQTIKVDSSISLDYLVGKFIPSKHEAFTLIERKYASRNGMYMRKEAYADFKRMHAAAVADGIQLVVKSATRPFNAQKTIWEGKWTGKRLVEGGQNIAKTIPDPKQRALKILEYSSMPGTSRHHWGTDIDLNNFTNEYFAKGKGLKEYEWLIKNAPKFGFCQTYTEKGPKRPYGYNEEKWHWSYLPIAKKLTEQYKLRLNDQAIDGFLGAETAVDIQVVKKYVLGINEQCL